VFSTDGCADVVGRFVMPAPTSGWGKTLTLALIGPSSLLSIPDVAGGHRRAKPRGIGGDRASSPLARLVAAGVVAAGGA
jgi:hypothetical protein